MEEVTNKRSYTIPVLLLILTGMAILLVLVASRLLLVQQAEKAEDGQRLADQYTQTILFAGKLNDGAALLLEQGDLPSRLKGMARIGEAANAAAEAKRLLADALSRLSGLSADAALRSVSEAADRLVGDSQGVLYSIGERDGPLTAEEKRTLERVQEASVRMREALAGFHVPSGDAGFRSMAAGEGWVQPALEAADTLMKLAAELGQP